jgi:hypothetical protein
MDPPSGRRGVTAAWTGGRRGRWRRRRRCQALDAVEADSVFVLDDEDPESEEDDELSDADDGREPDFDDERLSVL